MGHSKNRNERTSSHYNPKMNQEVRKGGFGQHNWGKPGDELSSIEATRISKSLANKKTLV
jgi:hypothetical protein